jgi:nucleoside-diphosphate-sugar epimerase
MDRKKILVTGATGFIGTHLVNFLQNRQYMVIPVNSSHGDVTRWSTWEQFPVADVVVHLAARSFVPDSWTDISGFMRCNLVGTVKALNYCKLHKARLVYLSSYLYGNPASLPINENAELAVNNPYSFSKKLAEEACEFYASSFGVPVTILRPFNVYGNGQSMQFLIPSLINQVKRGENIHVKDLEPKRDYVHVDDLVAAVEKAINYPEKFDVFNIGFGVSYSVSELIRIIQDHAHTNLPVTSDAERRKNEIMDTVADVTKAGKYLQWHPQLSLSDGIKAIMVTDNAKI